MSDEASFILLTLFGCLLAYAAFLRLFVVRPLRKKVQRLEIENARNATVPAAPVTQDPADLHRIKQRLQVLERIAVEKENTLSRDIEDLRAAG